MSTEEQVQDTAQIEEVVASPTDNEELDLELETSTPADDVEALKAKVAELEKKNTQLYARVKKTQVQPKVEPKVTESLLTREEAILIARGYSDEELKLALIIQKGAEATGEKISLSQATEHEAFKAVKAKKDAKARSEKAQLGASGSASNRQVDTAKMTPEQHEEYFHKKVKEALNG